MMKKMLSVLLACGLLACAALGEGSVYTASGDDESALDISGSEQVTLSGVTVIKDGGSASGADAASFRGLNSAVRVYDSAVLELSDSVIEASAPNATGVFAYDRGVVRLSGCTVTVTGGGAGGVQVAGGGTLYGSDLSVTSDSKAAIRSDRGGGTMVLEGGTYTSRGRNGCPAIYSTADITMRDALCVSEQSRAVIIEGKNTVTLENTVLEGNDQSTKEGSVKANVLLYQSMSGDAQEGTSVFSMTGGRMTARSGAMFYCTNTDSVIELNGAQLVLSEEGALLTVSAGRWGREGRNGGHCVLNARDQTLEGSIAVDGISSLRLCLTDSTYAGAIDTQGGAGEVTVVLEGESNWTLTGDSHISALEGDRSRIDLNGHTLYIDGEAADLSE